MDRDAATESPGRSNGSSAARGGSGLIELLTLARPFGPALALLSLLTVLGAGLTLAVPWLAGQLLGGMVGGVLIDRQRILGLLLICLAGTALFNFAVAVMAARTGANLLASLRRRVFDHVQMLALGFHESRGKGDTIALMTYEIRRLSDFLSGTLVSIPSRLVTTIGATI